MADSQRVEVVEVRPAPEGFDKAIALVSFIYRPGETDGPVKLTRWNANKKRSYDVGMIVGAKAIRIEDAPILQGERGEWCQVNGIELPRDVLAEVVKLANTPAPQAPAADEFRSRIPPHPADAARAKTQAAAR